MQKGEQNLPFAHQRKFRLQGFLDLDDHLPLRPDFLSRRNDPRAHRPVFRIRDAGVEARPFFHHHGVARLRESLNGAGRQGDPVFILFDFPEQPDFHEPSASSSTT